MNKILFSAAFAGILASGFAAHADDKMMESQSKCYGIAKAGQNACANANGVHSCKGQAKVDNDGGDFVLATASDCAKQGGSAEAKK
jgi:uncharacterized membrane protein